MSSNVTTAAQLRAKAAELTRLARRYEQAAKVLEDKPKRTIGKRLYAHTVVRKSGMTYRQIGELIGYSGSSVQKVASGDKSSRPLLEALSKLFEVSVEELQTPI